MNRFPGVPLRTTRWRFHALLAFGLVLWTLFCYRTTAASMVSIWARSETFAHGFLVVPIVLWLLWRQRAVLRAVKPEFSWIGVLFIAVSVACWAIGNNLNANVVRDFSLVGMLIAAVVTVIGVNAAKTVAFPLLFLLFAVPFGEFALPVLMKWTADFTVGALQLSGIPVYRDGMQFVIPSGNWSVVEACSGVRYLIASVSIGSLFAYLNFSSWQRRLVFVCFSFAVPIVANWLRAYMIVLLGHLTDNRLAAGVDHLIYGWVFFGVVISILFFAGSRWSQTAPGVAVPPVPSHLPAGPAGPAARTAFAVVIAVAVLAVGPLLR